MLDHAASFRHYVSILTNALHSLGFMLHSHDDDQQAAIMLDHADSS